MGNLQDEDTEKPLDPAVVRVQQRLQRMMLWSRGIMLVGFVALFAVIFYKFYWTRQTGAVPEAAGGMVALSPGVAPVASIAMPEGGRVTETHLEGGRLIVAIDAPKGASVLVLDLDTLVVLRRLDLPRGN